MNKSLLLVLAVGIAALGAASCKKAPVERSSNEAVMKPSVGAYCEVQFRRDALGAASDHPISPHTGSTAGVHVSVGGTFVRMDRDWFVIYAIDSELWIPRSAVLYVKILKQR